MKYLVYSIYDRLSHLYGNPFIQVNDACAIRYFASIVRKSPEMPAGDYDLMFIGYYYPEEGIMEPAAAKLLKNGGELMEVSE